ncbi:MAG TPA: sigma-70 family RNA polymerase sigma factor [Steroidobacteraceae bacterium]|nr:sigma-70 family RNA polymerase sigma factor [Steroidobacteraceae bacterium]
MLDPATPARNHPSHANLMRRPGTAMATENVPDLLLIERSRALEAPAIEALIRRYARRLYRVAHSVVTDAGRAEAIVQEAYLAAFGDLARYEPTGKFAAWLTRLTYQHARLQRATGARGANGEANATALTPEEQERSRLEQAIGSLPEVFRTVFVLRVLEGISGIETAAALGLHETTVRTRLYRAHRRLDEDTLRRVRAVQGLMELTPARLDHVVTGVLTQLSRRIPAQPSPGA